MCGGGGEGGGWVLNELPGMISGAEKLSDIGEGGHVRNVFGNNPTSMTVHSSRKHAGIMGI